MAAPDLTNSLAEFAGPVIAAVIGYIGISRRADKRQPADTDDQRPPRRNRRQAWEHGIDQDLGRLQGWQEGHDEWARERNEEWEGTEAGLRRVVRFLHDQLGYDDDE